MTQRDGQGKDLSRRQMLGVLGAAPVAAMLPAGVLPPAIDRAARAARNALAVGDYAPEFFTEHEWATVRMLVDLIIPADDRFGGATDAGVPEFMDFTMVDRPSQQAWMRDGLAWLDAESRRRFGAPFVELVRPQYRGLLDDIAWPDRAPEELEEGVAFFNRFRDMTASGYFSSRIGVEYLGYIGNAFNPGWDGCPPEARRHLGL